MAPHSSTLAWKIPRTEEPGGLQSMVSLRVGHDWATSPNVVVRRVVWYNFNFLKIYWDIFFSLTWSILDNFPCIVKNNLFSAAFEWNIYKEQFVLCIKDNISLLVFYLNNLFIDMWVVKNLLLCYYKFLPLCLPVFASACMQETWVRSLGLYKVAALLYFVSP